MQFWKNVDSYVDQYLIPVEKYGNLLILPNSEGDNFEEIRTHERTYDT
jgi:hypothetical protein